MADLVATNQRIVNLGGGVRLCYGQYTGTLGDAAATLTLPGSKVLLGRVYENSTGGDWVECPFSFTASANVLTITIASITTVADGYYCFLTL